MQYQLASNQGQFNANTLNIIEVMSQAADPLPWFFGARSVADCLKLPGFAVLTAWPNRWPDEVNMTIGGPTLLSLAASGVYALVVIICAGAAGTAIHHRQLPAHWRSWLIIALFFGVLILLRLVAAEELLRDYLRSSLRAAGDYSDRRSIQGPIVAAIIGTVGAGTFLVCYRWARMVRGRRNIARAAGALAALCMAFLIGLRLASLHLIDALLYGPLKLNWVIDLGASFVVIGAGVYYIRLVRQRP